MTQICFFTHNEEWLNNRLFDPEAAHDRRMEPMAMFREALLERGIRCDTRDRCDPVEAEFLACHRLDLVVPQLREVLRRNPGARLLLFAWEEPVVCGLHEAEILSRLDLDRIFCWRDDLAGRGVIRKANIPQPAYRLEDANEVPFAERMPIVAIDGNKRFRHPNELYSTRRRVIAELLDAGTNIHLYGRGWGDGGENPVLKSIWRGEVEDKLPIQSRYRFTLCFENSRGYPGDICEKIFDAFQAGTIPIYLGAPNIAEHIPPECFIDFRRFRDAAELSRFIEGFGEDEYLPMRRAIDHYMTTTYPEEFSGNALAGIVAEAVGECMREPPLNRNARSWANGVLMTAVAGLRKGPWMRKIASTRQLARGLLRA